MSKTILVLDASVVIKWFSNEEDSEKAINIRDKFANGDILIVCPDLQYTKCQMPSDMQRR